MIGMIAALVLLGVPVSTEEPETARKAKILLVATKPDHRHGTHMYRHECGFLAKMLQQTDGVEAVTSMYWPKDSGVLEGVDAVVWYSRPAADFVLAPPARESFLKLMKRGAGFVAIHWATGSSKKYEKEYTDILGGFFRKPPGGLSTTPSTLVQVDPRHPICNGWEPFKFRDEYYLDTVFHEKTKPLLKVTTKGKEQVVGWTLEREGHNGGRSFGTTLAHFHDNFEIQSFRRMLVNGILWAAGVEIPVSGAPVKATKEDLTLPPDPKKK